MSTQVVADSGIFIAAVLTETFSRQAKALIRQWGSDHLSIAAPTLLRYEIVAVIRKNVYRQTLTSELATQALSDLQLLTNATTFLVDEALLQRSYELAVKFARPTTYDSQYLAVAERLSCEFWTADERLFNAVKNDFSWIRWLGNFTPTT